VTKKSRKTLESLNVNHAADVQHLELDIEPNPCIFRSWTAKKPAKTPAKEEIH
jgi:hypothetical protein